MTTIVAALFLMPFPMPKQYLCHRTETPIVIDGRGSDPAWQIAQWTDEFVDIEGDAKPKPRFRTRVKMLWDDEYFYVYAEMEEPHVWGTLLVRDSVIFQDNDFEIFIDPDGDNHQYYEIEINALNTVWDLLLIKPYLAGGPAVNGWDIAGLRHAVFVDGSLNNADDVDRGWSVEFAIPWKGLKECAGTNAPPKNGDTWRVNFSRVQWEHVIEDGKYVKVPGKPEDNWVWSPQWAIDMHRPWLWGYVQFTTAKPGDGKLTVDESWATKELLMRIWWAQREFFKTQQRYANSASELNIEANVAIFTYPSGWEATAQLSDGRTLRVSHDARLHFVTPLPFEH
jgi:hypothetical protein